MTDDTDTILRCTLASATIDTTLLLLLCDDVGVSKCRNKAYEFTGSAGG